MQQHTTLDLPDPLAPAARRAPLPPADQASPNPRAARPHRTWQQTLSGLLLAGVCVTAALWYVPEVLRVDRHLLTGSVITSGVSTLNFTSAGEIERMRVHQGEHVHKGQLLVSEYAPDLESVLSADIEAIRSEKSKLASLSAAIRNARHSNRHHADPPTLADLSAVRAQITSDQAQLEADRTRAAASRLTAPASGTILAANGHPGEAVTTQGIHDYVTDDPRAQVSQTPAFSLLPEGPETDRQAIQSGSALPVIALRTSSAWQVATLVVQDAVSRIHVDERVVVSVPALHIEGVSGRISEILSTPVMTRQGDAYQAVISVDGHVASPPLSGMAADIRLQPAGAPSDRR